MPRGKRTSKWAALLIAFNLATAGMVGAQAPEPDAATKAAVADYLKKTSSKPHLIIFLPEHITASKGAVMADLIQNFSNRAPDGRMLIWVNSRGGNLLGGRLVIEAIRKSRSHIDIACHGRASSMAAMIFIAAKGPRVTRTVFKECTIMTHAPTWIEASQSHLSYENDRGLAADREKFAQMIAEIAGIPQEEALGYVTSTDKFYTLEESRRLKFFDRFIPQ